jgi:GxxExxY protein
MNENDITFQIRGAIFKVYNALGPGLLESVYKAVLVRELSSLGLRVKTEVPLPVMYENEKLEIGFRIDILVEDAVIIEIKSIDEIAKVHHKQILTYLKLSGKRLGILVNFNTDDIGKNIFRKVNGLPE